MSLRERERERERERKRENVTESVRFELLDACKSERLDIVEV